MIKLTHPIKLVDCYEKGDRYLMIVGSREALLELATKLNSALGFDSSLSGSKRPKSILDLEIQCGPYREDENYHASFYIESETPVEQQVLLRRRNFPPAFFAACGVFSLIGIVSALKWMSGFF